MMVNNILGMSLTVLLMGIILGMVTFQPAVLPFEEIKLAAQQYHQSSSAEFPLMNKIAIVTGSTSGLGMSIATSLYKLGAVVVLASRSAQKCAEIAQLIKSENPSSMGEIIPQVLDTSNLQSVQNFTNWYLGHYDNLDMLVNNAGINYATKGIKPSPDEPFMSKQGFDKLFATNYLGHFLLTEMLLTTLTDTPKARVIQVSSAAHAQSDGQDLLPTSPPDLEGKSRQETTLMPQAARWDVYTKKHFLNSYSNSKLAQIASAYKIQSMLNLRPDADAVTGLKIISVNPGLTDTAIVPPLMKKIFGRIIYTSDAASYSTLIGLFSRDLVGGEYLTNSFNPIFGQPFMQQFMFAIEPGPNSSAIAKALWRKFLIPCGIGTVLLQNCLYSTPRGHPVNSVLTVGSRTGTDITQLSEVTDKLYEWSLEVVKPFSFRK